MQKTSIITLAILILGINLSSYAAEIETITLTKHQDIQDANKLESAFQKYITKKSECINKKLLPRSACNQLPEFYQTKEIYQNTIKLHPSWRDSSIHWAFPQRGHHMELHSLKRNFK